MAFMYPHHVPHYSFQEDLLEPTKVSLKNNSTKSEKPAEDKKDTLVPDSSWAPRVLNRIYDPNGIRLVLPVNRPVNPDTPNGGGAPGSPIHDPHAGMSDDEDAGISDTGSHGEADDMDIDDNANSSEDIEDM